MSDILLSVGMQKGHIGSSQLEIDIRDVVDRISKNPPQVSVGLKVDQSALNHFKSQLTQIVNAISLTNGSPITINISGLGEVSAKATQANDALRQIGVAARSASDATSNMGDKQGSALDKVNTMLKSMYKNYKNWSVAQNTQASAAYQTYGQQIQALEALKLQVASNTISYEQFAQTLEAIKVASGGVSLEIIRGVNEYNAYQNAIAACTKEIELLKTQQEKWTAAKSGSTALAYNDLGRYQAELEDLCVQLQSGTITLDKFKSEYATITTAIGKSRKIITGAGKDTKSFGDRLGGLAEKFGSWLTVSQVIMQAVRAAKKMVSTVIEIDTAMTELKKVTEETDATYAKFLANAETRAKTIGATIADTVSATADAAKLGLDLDDASALADAALIYKNVGDGINDVSDASASIISTMKAFGIEASQAMSIVDRFNNVANNFAISTSGIGEALQRSAAAMSAANSTLDETIALATAANTIVQNPQTVGTTLKTLSMYLRASKTEAEEAGESIDGMASSTSELREELLSLTGNRLDIMIDEDTFKGPYQILKELSDVWDDLTDVSRANILEMIGGKRNSNTLSAILENFDIAEDALKASVESVGSALAENEKYIESIQGHITQFKASFEAFSTTVINGDLLKKIIDLGTVLLDLLDRIFTAISSVVELFGGLDTVLTIIGGVLISKVLVKIVSGLTNIARSGNLITAVFSNFGAYRSMFKGTASSIEMLECALADAGVAASSLQIAIGAFVAALTAGLLIYQAIKRAEEERQQAARDAIDAYNEQTKSVESFKEEITQLKDSMHSGTLSYEEYVSAEERLVELEREVVDTFGVRAAGLDLVASSAKDAAGALDDYLAASANEKLAKNHTVYKTAARKMEELKQYSVAMSGWHLASEELQNRVEAIVESIDGAWLEIEENAQHGGERAYIRIKENAEDAAKAITELSTQINNLQYEGLEIDVLTAPDGDGFTFAQQVETQLKSVQKILDKYQENYEGAIQLKIVANVVGDSDSNGYDDGYSGIMDHIGDITDAYSEIVADTSLPVEEKAGEISALYSELLALQKLVSEYDFLPEDSGVKQYFEDLISQLSSELETARFRAEVEVHFKNPDGASEDFTNLMGLFGAFKNEQGLIDYVKVNEMVSSATNKTGAGVSEQVLQWNALSAACAAYGTTIEGAMSVLAEYGYVAGYTGSVVNSTLGQMMRGYSEVKSEQEIVTKALAEQGAAGSISLDTYNELIAASGDYAKCLEYENGAIQINTDLAKMVLDTDLAEQKLELCRQIKKLQDEYASLTDQLENVADKESKHYKALVADRDAVSDNIAKYRIMYSELTQLSSAYTAWKAAQNAHESGEMYDDTKTALDQIKEGLKSGKVGTEQYQASLDLLVPDDVSADGRSAIKKYLKKLNKYITDDKSGAMNFVSDLIKKGFADPDHKSLDDFQLKAGTTIEEICKELKITPEMAKALFLELEEYEFDFEWSEADFDLQSLKDDVDDAKEELDKTIQQIESGEIEAPDVDTDTLNEYSTALGEIQDEIDNIQADPEMSDKEKADAVARLQEQAADIIAKAEEEGYDLGVTITATTEEDTRTQLEGISGTLDDIASKIDTIAQKQIGTLGADAADTALDGVIKDLEEIDEKKIRDKQFKVIEHRTIQYDTGSPKTSSSEGDAGARGTTGAAGGETLVGELGRELVVSGNKYRTVGDRGAELVNLKQGDIVFNHEDTERILSGKSGARGVALKDGNAAAGPVISGGGGFSSSDLEWYYNKMQSSTSGSSSRSSGTKPWKMFEKLYKYHNHLIAMEKERVADYLEWLDGASKEAYEHGEISLDDYRQYCEEVFDGLRDLFMDALGDAEHEISMREHYEGDTQTIIQLYQNMIDAVERELDMARSNGLTDSDDYIQELLDKWWDYTDAITDIYDEINSAAKDSLDDLIEYRIDMIKQDLENERDALEQKIDDLQDFYDTQKDMLSDARDEQEYLKEQSEKRKSVSDIEAQLAMLSNDDSAWAQKRKLELQEELAAAQDELAEFEDDHAYDLAIDFLDKAFERQEALIETEIEAIDKMLNDPAALYNQALTEIQNNTGNLYQEMLEYNRKYGTGNDDDVTETYEEAYKDHLNYKDLNGEYYKDIILSNSTSYSSGDESWDTADISGVNKPESENSLFKHPYGKVSEIEGKIRKGDKGDNVRALQHALNQLGFGNSGTANVAGSFGDKTQKAVKAFQKAMGVDPSGVVGTNTKKKFAANGYASGTAHATPGIHEVDELGPEYVFTSPSTGERYRMFTGGEKVLDAKATNFLYNFATSRGSILGETIGSAISHTLGLLSNGLRSQKQPITLSTGDIIIQGNADMKTVSEIRRAQRGNLDFIMKEFNKLNK